LTVAFVVLMLGFLLRRRTSTCGGIYASLLYFVVRVRCRS